jgi:tetratricopeptide (TPR) repeat protein
MASSRHVALVLVLVLSAGVASAQALLGPGVGTADTLVSEGSKLFNKKQYAKAAELFLKATRANPANAQTIVQLARAQLLAKQLALSCYAYRVYLKSVPDSPDRKKAAAESDQCERQLALVKTLDPTKNFVDLKAAFFTALDAHELSGANSASEVLKTLIHDGFLGPELGDMGQKLGLAATAEAEEVHHRALGGEKLTADTLRSARPRYQLAQDVGVTSADARGRMAFLDGLAELQERAWKKAESHFAEAARDEPANREYIFYKGLAMVQAGERAVALKLLEAELKDDPRTAVLRVALGLSESSEAGAFELEKLLFSTRDPP